MDPGSSSRALVAMVLITAAWNTAACNEAVDRTEDSDPTPASSPARTISPAKRLAGRYSLNGRERRVSVSIAPTLITRKRRNDYAVVPPGREQVQIDVRLDDEGPDRLDLSVVRFAAVDHAGRRVAEAFRLPPRELEPDSRASARIVSVGFMVRSTARLTKLRMRSILTALPGRLSWRVDDPGR